MKSLRYIFCGILVVLLLFHSAYAVTLGEELDYWDQPLVDTTIGYTSPANIRLTVLSGGLGETTATSHINTACNQWVFISISMDSSSPGNIFVYDGSRDSLEKQEPALANYNALTVINYADAPIIGSNTYNNSRKYVRHIQKAYIYIPKQSWLSFWDDTNYKGAYVHEFGHALGWWGHCTGSSALMYNRSKLNFYTLTWYDRRHIYQIYY